MYKVYDTTNGGYVSDLEFETILEAVSGYSLEDENIENLTIENLDDETDSVSILDLLFRFALKQNSHARRGAQ